MQRASLLVLVLAACHGKAPGATPAAKVENRTTEAALTRVHLAPAASARLGLQSARVEARDVASERTYAAEVVAPTGGTAAMTAPVAGIVRVARTGRLPGVGTTVDKGQVILELVPIAAGDRDLRAQTQQRLETARARLTQLEAQATRSEALAAERAVSVRAAEEARAQRDAGRAEVTAAEKRLRLVDDSPLASDVSIPLRAPWAGVLQRLHASPGQTVAAGAPLFEVVHGGRVWLKVSVFIDDLERIDRAAPARVHRLGVERGDAGRAALPLQTSAVADPATATADLYYELDAGEGGPRAGHRVGVSLRLRGGSEPRAAVPWSAVVFDADGGAWVYERTAPDTFVRRRVMLGPVVDGWAALLRGPAVGSDVVTVGAMELFGVEFGAGK